MLIPSISASKEQMSTKLKVLEMFNENYERFISGQELADTLGLSRNSVWKAIEKLRSEGFVIESKHAAGYKLVKSGDILSQAFLKDAIKRQCRVHVLEQTDSTNNYAKRLTNYSMPNIIIADHQTAGRGRMGRSFYSPHAKGIYMTIAFEPDFALDKAMFITSMSSLAVCHAFEQVAGIGPKIKWVNDIYLNGKKVCGILTEAESNFETGCISRIIVGIGINCFEQVFPEELKDKATYIESPPKEFTRNQMASAVVNNFFDLLDNFDRSTLRREYKARSMILGEQIILYGTSYGALPEHGGRGIRARAIDIDENGGLVVEYMEGRHSREMDTITSGEVSIRRDI